jgi:opacity protein-like surface antigen
MTITRSLLPGALLCSIAGTAAAQSADRDFYLSADLGQAEVDRRWPQVEDRNDDDFAWKLRFGYRFSRHVSLEAAFTNFGEYHGLFYFSVFPGAIGSGDYTTSAKSIDLSVVGSWPLGRVVYLKAAVGLTNREYKTVYAPVFAGAPSARGTDGDLGIQYGAGLGFTLSESLDVSLDWATTGNLEGDIGFPQNDLDPSLLSVGLRFKF